MPVFPTNPLKPAKSTTYKSTTIYFPPNPNYSSPLPQTIAGHTAHVAENSATYTTHNQLVRHVTYTANFYATYTTHDQILRHTHVHCSVHRVRVT